MAVESKNLWPRDVDREITDAEFCSLVLRISKRSAAYWCRETIPNDVDDVASEAAYSLIQKIDKNAESCEWVLWTLVNRSVQWTFWAYLKKSKKQRGIGIQLSESIKSAPPLSFSLDNTSVRKEREIKGQIVRRCMQELSMSDRKAIFLFHYFKLSHIKTAEQLGIKPESSRVKVFRASGKFRRCVERRIKTQGGKNE